MRRPHGDAVFQHAAAFGVGLRCGELEFRAVEFVGHALGKCLPGHAEHGRRGGGRSLDELTTIYTRTLVTLVHVIASHLVFCRPRTMCCDGLSIIWTKSNTIVFWESCVNNRQPAVRAVGDPLAASAEAVLQIEDLQTQFFTSIGTVRAVDGVSYELKSGETLGVVGESGCGKSVSALSILRLIANPPGRIVGGTIRFQGTNLLELSEREM